MRPEVPVLHDLVEVHYFMTESALKRQMDRVHLLVT